MKNRIVKEQGVRSGQPIFKGTRLTVKDVIGYINSGMSFKEILEDFPSLCQKDLTDAIDYAKNHKL